MNISRSDPPVDGANGEGERPAHVLVTGAGGYIGPHVVRALLDSGVQVTALDRGRGSRSNLDSRAKVVIRDIFGADSPDWDELGRPDVCIHLAWEAGFDHDNAVHLSRLSAHYDFLKKLLDGGLPQLTVLGTMHEVGYVVGEVHEDTPAAPQSLYGIAKNALRGALEIETQRTQAVFQWLRCFYIVGDDRRNRSIFNKILLAADDGLTAFPMNSGESRYDFVHVDDLAQQVAAAAVQTSVAGIIHCGSGTAIPLREQVERFVRENDLRLTLEFGKYPERPYDSPAAWGDSRKINAIMNARCR